MFAVAGVSGNTGSVVAKSLLARGNAVRVIVRDAAKGAAWKEKGAEVAVASLEDSAALAAALDGVSGAYLLLPPDYGAPDFLASRKRAVDAYRVALAKAKPAHVAFLSSIAAQHAGGTGPIRSVAYAEKQLGDLGPITFIRASYFMENWGHVLTPARSDGVLPAFFDEDKSIPMVATADIGETAAQALVDGPRGKRIIELAGPAEYSAGDVAKSLTTILARPVKVLRVPDEGRIGALTQAGFTPDVASLFAEMYAGIQSGHVIAASKDVTRGKTTLEAFLRTLV